MNIVGIIVILILPYLAGYILRTIFGRKGTTQIETYLIGFFFLFLLQGIIFNVGQYAGSTFDKICKSMDFTVDVICILFLLLFVIGSIYTAVRAGKDKASRKFVKFSRGEKVLISAIVLLAIALVVRVYFLVPYLRTDETISNIRLTIATNTMFEYNPLTNQLYELGLIPSRKVITLPLFYSYWVMRYGIDEAILLYFVVILQSCACSLAVMLDLVMPIFRSRHKSLLFFFFAEILFLSGDYFRGSFCYKLLHTGYLGESIVAAIMIPYVMYVITSWYRLERSRDVHIIDRIRYVSKLCLVLAAAVFITPIAKGVLLLCIVIAALSIVSVFRFSREEV